MPNLDNQITCYCHHGTNRTLMQYNEVIAFTTTVPQPMLGKKNYKYI